MPTKQETIDSITPTSQYLGKYVRELITGISSAETKMCPEYFKKGDVILLKCRVKPRPGVIIKVTATFVICIPLTSTENEHCMSESKSRFFRTGCFCNSYEIVPLEMAQQHFLGVYDSPKLLNNAIKELRQFISKHI